MGEEIIPMDWLEVRNSPIIPCPEEGTIVKLCTGEELITMDWLYPRKEQIMSKFNEFGFSPGKN